MKTYSIEELTVLHAKWERLAKALDEECEYPKGYSVAFAFKDFYLRHGVLFIAAEVKGPSSRARVILQIRDNDPDRGSRPTIQSQLTSSGAFPEVATSEDFARDALKPFLRTLGL